MTNQEIEKETGRAVHEVQVPCDMCDSLGWSMFEDPCTACAGEGRVTITAYRDCGHDVESEDCKDDRCTFCRTYECDEPRKPFDEYCTGHAAIRDDAKRTFDGAVQAGMIDSEAA